MEGDYVGIKIKFEGDGLNEYAYVESCNHESYSLEIGKQVVKVNPKYFRPTEVDRLIGDSSKARNKLKWKPKYDLKMLVDEMMENDLKSN